MTEPIRATLAILRRKQVEHAVGLSRSTIYQRMKDGTFPRPVRLGPGSVGWRVADIDQFLVDPAGYRWADFAPQPSDSVRLTQRGDTTSGRR